MAIPSMRAFSILAYGAGANAVGDKPTGAAEGDGLRADLFLDVDDAITTVPTDWTQRDMEECNVGGNAFRHYLYTKRAGSSEPSTYTWSGWSGTPNRSLTIISFKDVKEGAADDWWSFVTSAVRDNTSASTYPDVSETTLDDKELLSWVGGMYQNPTSHTPPAGFVERNEAAGTVLYFADKMKISAGATGTITGASYTGGSAGPTTVIMLGVRPSSVWPPRSALKCSSGVFTLSTGAPGTTQDIQCLDELGQGYRPVGGLLFMMGRTDGTDAVGGANCRTSIGIFDSFGNRFAVAKSATDAAGTSDASRSHTDAAVLRTISVSAIEGDLDIEPIANWPADGFRVIVDDQFPTAHRVGWIAWGGEEIDAICVQFQEPAATGNQDITTPGVNVEANGKGVVIAISAEFATAPPSSSFNATAGQLMIGAASGVGKQGVLTTSDDQGSTSMDTASYHRDDEVIAMQPATVAAVVDARATFNAWITNGLQFNYAERVSTRYIFALVIKGGLWEVGSFLTNTDTSTPIVEDFGFRPKGVLCFSACKAESAADTGATHDEISIGVFTSATNRHAQACICESGNTDEQIGTAIEHDAIYANISTADAIEGLGDVQSIDPRGFTAIMDDADPAQALVVYVACGSALFPPQLLDRRRLAEAAY